MKPFITSLILSIYAFCGFSQTPEKVEKIGISRYIKPGIMLGGFYNPTGEYVYILQSDAHVKQTRDNKGGGSISLVLIFPLDKTGAYNILLNVPVFDIKGNLTDVKVSNGLFNTQTPFGLGLGFFPFPKTPELGFSIMGNYLNQNKLRDDALQNRYFPIADYPTFDLQVAAPVPEAVLKPFLRKEPSVTITGGIIFRL